MFVLGRAYDAEHQFLEGQREMVHQAHHPQLQELLTGHVDTTQQQIQRIEQIFSHLGQSPQRIPCEVARGLVTDGRTALQEVTGNPQLTDVVIADAQCKIEHVKSQHTAVLSWVRKRWASTRPCSCCRRACTRKSRRLSGWKVARHNCSKRRYSRAEPSAHKRTAARHALFRRS